MGMILEGVLRMPPSCWSGDALDVAQRHAIYCEAADLIEMAEGMKEGFAIRIADLEKELASLRINSERYRKLRDMGDHQTFGEYVVVKCEGLPVGTQTWSGKRLDAICDEMEAADAKPE